jgi:hypothetical protein
MIGETVFANLSESAFVSACLRVMEDFKANPRINENRNSAKGLLNLVQGSPKIKSIIEEDSNCSILLKGLASEL